jgi:hypothetical protein
MYSYADGGMAADAMMADPMADPLMDGLPMGPMAAQAPGGGDDPETLAAAAFEVATEYLPAVPTPVLEQTLMAFAAEFEQRMAGDAAMQPQAPMAAPAEAMPPQGIGSLV